MKTVTRIIFISVWALLTGCSCSGPEPSGELVWEQRSSLPEPVSNNAVASVTVEGNSYIYSFMGLPRGKSFRDVHSRAFKYSVESDRWKRIADVPGDSGRLAGVAVTAGGDIYIFGGYTVAEDGSEKSVPDVYRLNPRTDRYRHETRMPVPVDDAVAAVYENRYVYLVSGWHDSANVDHVQIYDTREKEWRQATSFPGPPVFGHAGGISGNRLLITGGVKIVQEQEGGRRFTISPESWTGTITPDSTSEISWRQIPHHSGEARYRMAGIGTESRVLFAGGTTNPYNYNGIGYNGISSEPDSTLLSYDFSESSWDTVAVAPVATMDHRSLLKVGDWYYLVGGMHAGRQVSDKVFRYKLRLD